MFVIDKTNTKSLFLQTGFFYFFYKKELEMLQSYLENAKMMLYNTVEWSEV